MTKQERAIELRDLALLVVKARGVRKEMRGGPSMLHFENKHLMIAYRSPSLGAMPPGNLPHGLDIWRRWWLVPLPGEPASATPKTTKVLNVAWNDADLVVASYKAGRWEQELEKLAASLSRSHIA